MASLNIPNFSREADPVNFVNEAAIKDIPEVLKQHGTTPNGLTEAEAATRLEKFGPNQVAEEKHHGWIQRIYTAARNPLVILLTILAIITFATAGGASDIAGGMLMVAMVVLGISLRFIQETKADNAAAKLKAMISVTATVVRDGQQKEIPLKQLVPGDVRLLSAKDLFIIQATLTGESTPVEKTDARDARTNVSSIEHTNICFLGTSVESGAATAV